MRCIVVFCLLTSIAAAQPTQQPIAPGEVIEEVAVTPLAFGDAAATTGIGNYARLQPGYGGGVAAADYDGDGWIDLFVPTDGGQPDLLYHNVGGAFEEVGFAAGVANTDNHRAALWLDYDADGDLDLLVGGDCFESECPTQNTLALYSQEALGVFVDRTRPAGLRGNFGDEERSHFGGMCAGDINNDGYPDIYVAVWRSPAKLFLNNGDGTFADISDSSGVAVKDTTWQPMMWDINSDGWQDIYVATDFVQNYLWINQGDNTFVDMAGQVPPLDNVMNDMGMALADYDNDGDLDIYTTNIYHEDRTWNTLFRNDSTGPKLVYTEYARQTRIDDGAWGWGATFFDADLDGRLDLAATNGYLTGGWQYDTSRFFRNLGVEDDVLRYADLSNLVGYQDNFWGSAVIAIDHDRDGDLDLAQTCFDGGPLLLLENRLGRAAAGRHYLVIEPRMTGPNRFAINAVVRVQAGDLRMMRILSAGSSFLGQEPYELHFGLGNATTADVVKIEWPDGAVTTLYDVPADQTLRVVD